MESASISAVAQNLLDRRPILIAEDNPLARKVAVRQLERMGFKVDQAADGREVIEAIKRANYAAVLMDCEMPEMDGFQATREIRRMEGDTHHTRIIAVTGHEEESERDKCRAAGMDDFATKPLKPETLARMLEMAPAQAHAPSPEVSAIVPRDEEPILDLAMIAELRDDQELLDDLIETFINKLPDHITQLADQFAHVEFKAASMNAHSLKGSAANLGAKRMRAICAALDMMARNGAVENVAALLSDLRVAHREACLALAAHHSAPADGAAA